MQELIHNGVQPIQATWQNSIGMKFCWCPPGTFIMGSPETETGRKMVENQVEVTLSQGFWLGKYEVTQQEWERVMGTKPWSDSRLAAYNMKIEVGQNYPATCVKIADAEAYYQKLTQLDPNQARLFSDGPKSPKNRADFSLCPRS